MYLNLKNLKNSIYLKIILRSLLVLCLFFILANKSYAYSVCLISVDVRGSTVEVWGEVRETLPGRDPSWVAIQLFTSIPSDNGVSNSAIGEVINEYYVLNNVPDGDYQAYVQGESIANPGGIQSSCVRGVNFSVQNQPTYPPPSCSPQSQTVNVGQSVNLSASGGDGNYSWLAPGGSPGGGTGNNFSTSYSSPGTKTITINSANQSSDCTVNVVQPPPLQEPGPFSLSGVCQSLNSSQNRANLSWTNSSGATDGYDIYYREWSNGQVRLLGSVSQGTTSYSTNVRRDRDYYFLVEAKNSGGRTVNNGGWLLVCQAAQSQQLPTVDIKFNGSDGPVTINQGNQGVISWTVTNASSCTASGGWSGNKSVNGGQENSGPINNSTTFNLECFSSTGGSRSDSVTVNVSGGGGSESCILTANPPGGNFPLNGVRGTININNFDGSAHEFRLDCHNDGNYEYNGIITNQNPYTFSNTCNYNFYSTMKAYSRNLNNQAVSTCTANITMGFLDSADCFNISGWAIDQDSPSTAITVELYRDGPYGGGGVLIGSFTTNVYRQDVNDILSRGWGINVTGNHGFSITTPAYLADGNPHRIYAYAIDLNNGLRIPLVDGGQNSPPKIVQCGLPTVDLLCDGNQTCGTVNFGSSRALSWSVTGGDVSYCTASGAWSGNKNSSGSESTGPINSNRTWTIQCTGPAGTGPADSVSATVSAPTVDIKANNSDGPITVPWNSNVNLSWTSTNAGVCSASGNWSGNKSIPSGSENTGNLTIPQTYNYTLTCSGNGSVADTVQVVVNPPAPVTSNVTVTVPDYCTTGPSAWVSWDFSDPSGGPQSAYQVQIDNQSSFNSPEFDSGQVNCSNCRQVYSNLGILQFQNTYRARVRTWNSYGVVSPWQVATSCIGGDGCQANGSWVTPNYAYPNVYPPYHFTWLPPNPAVSSPVQFTDRTLFSPTSNNRQWLWTFVPAGGGSGSSTAQNPAYTFNTAGVYQVTENVRDSSMPPGRYCSYTQSVSIQKSIPIWKEIAPR